MYSVEEINEKLVNIPVRMSRLSEESIVLKREFRLAKAKYDIAMAHISLTKKAENPDMTQTDINAHATVGSEKERMQLIEAESKYNKTVADISILKDKLDAVKELSYNLRNERKYLNTEIKR